MLKSKHRIVPDHYNGFEVQKKRWWFPIWIQLGVGGRSTNTSSTIKEAECIIEKDKEKPIYYD